MDHVVYLDASAKEFDLLLSAKKKMIIRGATGRKLPYGRVSANDVLYFIYASCSYLFLDSRLTAIASRGVLLGLAALLMIAGLSLVLLSMPILGRRSFGAEVGQLYTKGIYRFSRNPQLVGSFSFIVGYVLLWPSWTGALWAALWLPISYLMVRGEEEHLASVFGKQYEEYCRRTARYIGVAKERQR